MAYVSFIYSKHKEKSVRSLLIYSVQAKISLTLKLIMGYYPKQILEADVIKYSF